MTAHKLNHNGMQGTYLLSNTNLKFCQINLGLISLYFSEQCTMMQAPTNISTSQILNKHPVKKSLYSEVIGNWIYYHTMQTLVTAIVGQM